MEGWSTSLNDMYVDVSTVGVARTPDNKHRGPIQNHQISETFGPDASAVVWSGLSTDLRFGRTFGPEWYHRCKKNTILFPNFSSRSQNHSLVVLPPCIHQIQVCRGLMWEVFSRCQRTAKSSLTPMSIQQWTPEPRSENSGKLKVRDLVWRAPALKSHGTLRDCIRKARHQVTDVGSRKRARAVSSARSGQCRHHSTCLGQRLERRNGFL